MDFASRVRGLDVSGIRKLFEAARPNAIHLGIGEPHVQPAPHVMEAHIEAIRDGKNRYSPTAGIPELRDALVNAHAKAWPGIGREHVAVTSGSTAGLFAALFSLVEQGDEVLVPDPGFVLYEPHPRLCGATPVTYPVRHDNEFEPDVDEIAERITDRTKVLIVNSPGNPTGVTLRKRSVDALADLANDHGIWLITDEAYDAITYDVNFTSFIGRVEKLVYLNTFSKRYAMTGWRLGYAVAPVDLAKHIRTVCYHMYAAPETPAQYAALAALTGPQDHVDQMVRELRIRRDHMVKRLADLPNVELVPPTGAFYAFPRVKVPVTSLELAMRLLQAGVVTAPGNAFGAGGEGHIRFSFATDLEKIDAGLHIVHKVLEGF